MALILGTGLTALIGYVLFAIGGWWWLLGGSAVLIWLGSRSVAKKATPAIPKPQAETQAKQEPSRASKIQVLKPAYVPTPEQMAQIEQARQSSLATLRAQERTRKAAAKAARQVPAKRIEPPLDPIEMPDRVAFTYKRSDGVISQRTVVVNKVDGLGGKFTGFCETARSVKTFKASSVQGTVTRYETGEIVNALSWFYALKPSAQAVARTKRKTLA